MRFVTGGVQGFPPAPETGLHRFFPMGSRRTNTAGSLVQVQAKFRPW